ncbi:MAG: SusC/RagA family TonB-linked outer membrane protein, partial [Chitinophagales bacterium]
TPIRKADGTYAYSNYADTDIANPVNAIEQSYDTYTTHRVVGSLFAEATITKGLKIRTNFSVDATFANRDIFRPSYDLSNNPILGDAPSAEKTLINSVSREYNMWRKWQWETVLNYSTKINEVHKLDVTLGNTRLAERFDYGGGSNTNLPSNDPNDALLSNTIDPLESQGAYAGAEEGALLSYFGRVNYEYDDRYLFSATLRRDGSSNFGPNNRYGSFPSFSLGWVASQEDFWNQDGLINFFKVRGSWGQNGNDRIGRFAYLSVVSTGQNYSFEGDENITNGSLPITASNPDIQWETSTQTNFGIDVGMFNNRVNLIADYYIKNTTDMLAAPPIPEIVGAEAPFRNIGEVQNSGLELALEYKNRLGGLKYSVSGNIAFVSTEVINLGNDAEPITTGSVQSAGSVARTEVGNPVAAFYGYVTDGIFQDREEIAAHAFQNENTAPGDIRFKDLNNDGMIDDADREFIGNPSPDFTYGANIDASFKGFDISIFLQGVHGNEIYNATTRYDFIFTNRQQSVLNRWTGPGTSNFEPRVTIADPNFNARASDRFIEDGSYFRVKNVQLGYSLPQTITDKLKISKFRVYVSAQNLFTSTNYSGLDPEIGTRFNSPLEIGIDRGFYPQAKTILGGVNVAF